MNTQQIHSLGDIPLTINTDDLRDAVITDPRAFYSHPRTAEQSRTVGEALFIALNTAIHNTGVVTEDNRDVVVAINPDPDDPTDPILWAMLGLVNVQDDILAPLDVIHLATAQFDPSIVVPQSYNPDAGRFCGISRTDAQITAEGLEELLHGLWEFLGQEAMNN